MNIQAYRDRHPEHLGEAGGYCITCALINELKEIRLQTIAEIRTVDCVTSPSLGQIQNWKKDLLDEVKREVEKKAGEGTLVSIKDISTIIDQLKLK